MLYIVYSVSSHGNRSFCPRFSPSRPRRPERPRLARNLAQYESQLPLPPRLPLRTLPLFAFCGETLGRRLTFGFTDFARWLDTQELKPASQNRAFAAIKSLFSFGQTTGYLPFNVGAALQLRPNRDGLAQRILAESDVARLIERTPDGRDQVILRLLYASGARVSELAQLKWCDTMERTQEGKEVAGQISVFGKGGKTRPILLKPRTWVLLLSLRGGALATDPVFRSQKGGHLDVSQMRRIVYRACERAGLEQKVSPPLDAPRPRQPCIGPRRAHSSSANYAGAFFGFDHRTISPRQAWRQLGGVFARLTLLLAFPE